MHPRAPALIELASRQAGVVTRAQATALGVAAPAQRLRMRSGEWMPRLGCLVIAPDRATPDWRDAWALGLRLGKDAIVTGPTALRLHSLPVPDTNVVCWCPPPLHLPIAGVRVLRDGAFRPSSPGPAFRVADPLVALVDTLVTVKEARALDLLDLALQRHWLSPAEWPAAVEQRLGRGRTGATRLRMLGARVGDGTRSEAERRLHALLLGGGLTGWHCNYPLRMRGGTIVAELDFALPELKLCLEVDGRAHHSDEADFERDRVRQNTVQLMGWLVLRFTWHQIVNNPSAVMAEIRRAIALRSAA